MYDELQMEDFSSNSGRSFSRRKIKAIRIKGDISCYETKCQSILKKHFKKSAKGCETSECFTRGTGTFI